MSWKIVFQKFITTAITGAISSLATVASSPAGLDGLDPKSTGLVAILIGVAGALFNWWKHKDIPEGQTP